MKKKKKVLNFVFKNDKNEKKKKKCKNDKNDKKSEKKIEKFIFFQKGSRFTNNNLSISFIYYHILFFFLQIPYTCQIFKTCFGLFLFLKKKMSIKT